jgi:hypothetical protein
MVEHQGSRRVGNPVGNRQGFALTLVLLTGWLIGAAIYTYGLFVWMAYDLSQRTCDAGFCGYGAGGSF